MDAPVIDTVAKYFYYSCLDEQVCFTASLKTLSEIRANGWMKDRSRWIQVLSKWKPRLKKLHGKSFGQNPGFEFEKDFDVSAWSNFMTTAEPTEVEAVLLSKILGFRDAEIATGLGITVGTVRYRVGRGLRHLGGYLES